MNHFKDKSTLGSYKETFLRLGYFLISIRDLPGDKILNKINKNRKLF
jgi:hypothetical protein